MPPSSIQLLTPIISFVVWQDHHGSRTHEGAEGEGGRRVRLGRDTPDKRGLARPGLLQRGDLLARGCGKVRSCVLAAVVVAVLVIVANVVVGVAVAVSAVGPIQ